jgi:Protein of unknown function (DUF2911)
MRNARLSFGLLVWLVLWMFALLVFAPAVAAQGSSALPGTENAVCSFEDGRQVSVRYVRVAMNAKEQLRAGKIWTPGGSPLLLFTETKLSVGRGSEIAPGAYSVFLMPGKEDWTLIVSSNVSSDGKYQEGRDVARARMDAGELNQPEAHVTIYFGHVGPRQCDMRLDYGKTRAWVEFREQ